MPDGQSRTLESRPFRNSKIKPTEKKKSGTGSAFQCFICDCFCTVLRLNALTISSAVNAALSG